MFGFLPGNLGQAEKTVLARWAYRNNGQRLRIPGLGNIFGPFCFEFIRKYSENLIALMFGFLPTTIIQVKNPTPPFHIV
jgi:hypothetical protein